VRPLRAGLRPALAVFGAAWVGWALLGLLGVGIVPPGQPPVSVPGLAAPPVTPGWHNLLTPGERDDALWYLRIATQGYRADDASPAFFPLYPLAVRTLAALPLVSPLAAATVLAQASALGGLVVLFALTTYEHGPAVASRTLRYLATFPTAFFLLSPFTEAPFLLLTVLTFWFARRGRWAAAALPAALAGATRSAGVVLVPALIVEALVQGRDRLGRRLAAACTPLAGLAAYAVYWLARTGSPIAPLDAQRGWQREWAWPWATLWHAVDLAWRYQSYWLIDLIVVLAVLVPVLTGWRWLAPSYAVYAAASLLLPLCQPFPSRPLMSMPRFVLVVFPALWVLARSRLPEPLVLCFSAGSFVLLGLLFTNWFYIF